MNRMAAGAMPAAVLFKMEAQPMWNGDSAQEGMMGWDGGWNWLFGFQGVLSLIFLTIIVVVGIALFRDWRRGRRDGSDLAKPERE